MTAPLHPPLSEVIRIPITGPGPYNTLAYLRFDATPTVSALEPVIHPGDLAHRTTTSPTPLIIAGYDPTDDRQQQVLHCSTAVLVSLAATGDDAFTAAIDSIDPEAQIDEHGRVMITWNWAIQFAAHDGELGFACGFTSWVLLYEPRLAPPRERDQAGNLHVSVPVGTPPLKHFGGAGG